MDTYSSDESDRKEKLLPILELSTRKFVHHDHYRTDLRYLKLWALYARQCSRVGSTKIYEYLDSKQIGIHHSMFYEEWANAIESAFGDLEQAQRVLDSGIQRQAEPIGRLQKRRKAVLKKISESSTDPSKDPQAPIQHPLNAFELSNGTTTSSKLQVYDEVGHLCEHHSIHFLVTSVLAPTCSPTFTVIGRRTLQ